MMKEFENEKIISGVKIFDEERMFTGRILRTAKYDSYIEEFKEITKEDLIGDIISEEDENKEEQVLKVLEEKAEEYSYLEATDIPIYSKNLTEKEAKILERVITKVAYSFWYGNKHFRDRCEVEDVRQDIVNEMLMKPYKKEGKRGNKKLVKDEYGNPVLRGNGEGIPVNLPHAIYFVKNVVKDLNRSTKRASQIEDRDFDLDYTAGIGNDSKKSGLERFYFENENGKMYMGNSADKDENFNTLLELMLNKEKYTCIDGIDINSKKFEKDFENLKKYVVVQGYINGSVNDPNIYKLYKEYESELTEDQRELLAMSEANKEETGGVIPKDTILRTFFNMGTGINSGSAHKITKFIPFLLKEMVKREAPDYLGEAGINLN